MEQAQALRLQPGQSVRVILLTASDARFAARISAISGRRVGLVVPSSLETGQPVRIESGDDAFLGEVIWCHGGPEAHVATVDLDQALTGLAALGRMLRLFSEEPLRAEPLNAVQNRSQEDHQQSNQ